MKRRNIWIHLSMLWLVVAMTALFGLSSCKCDDQGGPSAGSGMSTDPDVSITEDNADEEADRLLRELDEL